MEKISIVIPCFNEQEALPIFYKEIKAVMHSFDSVLWELCFIDDGSTDETLHILRNMAKEDDTVRYTSFSRNFGKEAGMYAGLEMATGDYVAIMDVDLQDPPAMLLEMYEILQTEDYDCVATFRQDRKGEPWLRSLFAKLFYKVMRKLSKADIVDGARDFRLMRRPMVDAILKMSEYNRFSKGIFAWVGFKTKWLPFHNVERSAGKTKWSFFKLLSYSMSGVMAFSNTPLLLSSILGGVFCLIALVMLVIIIGKTLLFGDPVSGWPSMMCAILMIGGLQFFCIGIVGQYLAKTYMEVKNRPIYITRETERGRKDEALLPQPDRENVNEAK